MTITRTPDLPLGGGSTGSCAATSNTITVTRTHTVTTTSTSTSTHTASGATDAPSPSSSAHLPQPPPSSSSNTRPTASASETTSAAQNASQAIVTAFFTPGGLPSIGPLQNYTLPVPSGSHHSSETSPAPHPSDSPSAKPPEQSPSASPDSSAATGSSTGSGANPGSTPGAGHSTGEKKPCEITVYTYAPTSNCIQTFDSVGACGFTTYFPKFANNGMSKLAVPAEIFDSFGGVAQNNPMCGSKCSSDVPQTEILLKLEQERSLSLLQTVCHARSWSPIATPTRPLTCAWISGLTLAIPAEEGCVQAVSLLTRKLIERSQRFQAHWSLDPA